MSAVALGDWLLGLRNASRFSADELAARTKIHPRFLDALERGDLQSLPSPVHARAFALAYARACGASEEEALQRVREAFAGPAAAPGAPLPVEGAPAPAPHPLIHVMADEGRRRAPAAPWKAWLTIGLSAAILLYSLVWISDRLAAPKAQLSPSGQQPEGLPSASPSKEGTDSKKSPEAGPSPTQADSGQPKPRPDNEAAPEESAPKGPGEYLELRARRPTWVLLEIDGKRLPTILLERQELAKERYLVKEKAIMLLGNAGAVRVWWRNENLGYLGELGQRRNGVVLEMGQPWRLDPLQDLPLPPGVPATAPGP